MSADDRRPTEWCARSRQCRTTGWVLLCGAPGDRASPHVGSWVAALRVVDGRAGTGGGRDRSPGDVRRRTVRQTVGHCRRHTTATLGVVDTQTSPRRRSTCRRARHRDACRTTRARTPRAAGTTTGDQTNASDGADETNTVEDGDEDDPSPQSR